MATNDGPLLKPTREPKPAKPLQRKTPLNPFKYKLGTKKIFVRDPVTQCLVIADPRVPERVVKSTKGPDEAWATIRHAWYDLNPPDLPPDYYQCRLCPYAVHKNEATLDHIKPKGVYKHLKYELSNLQPAHYLCNQLKGSMSMESYKAKYPNGPLNHPVI